MKNDWLIRMGIKKISFKLLMSWMLVIDPLALKQMVPGSGLYILAPVFVPLDVPLFPQHPGILVSSDHPQMARAACWITPNDFQFSTSHDFGTSLPAFCQELQALLSSKRGWDESPNQPS